MNPTRVVDSCSRKGQTYNSNLNINGNTLGQGSGDLAQSWLNHDLQAFSFWASTLLLIRGKERYVGIKYIKMISKLEGSLHV